MGSQKIKVLLIWIIAISMAFAFNSCGARKSEKARTEETIETEIAYKSKIDKSEVLDSNVKKSETTIVDDQNQTTTVKKTMEPVDPEKPSSYTDDTGKKKELNNAKETIETTTKKNNTKTESDIKTNASVKTDKKDFEQKDLKINQDIVKKDEEINVDRKAWSIWNIAWLLLVIPVYWLWKNKGIIKRPWWI